MNDELNSTIAYCTHHELLQAADKCSFAQSVCSPPQGLINFFTFYYCNLNGNPFYAILLFGFILLLIFVFLKSTAEKYLTPNLEKLAISFNLSQTLAGVTLLAFANGSPDVISSFTAGGEAEGIYISVGSLFGAGLFVTTFVLSRVIMMSSIPNVTLNPYSIVRDIAFYLFGTWWVLIIGWIGEVSFWHAFVFLLLYITYFHQYSIKLCFPLTKIMGYNDTQFIFFVNFLSYAIIVIVTEKKFSSQKSENKDIFAVLGTEIKDEENMKNNLSFPDADAMAEKYSKIKGNNIEPEPLEIDHEDVGISSSNQHKSKLSTNFIKFKQYMLFKLGENYPEFFEMNLLEKIIYAIEYPLIVLRDLTIPPSEEKNYKKLRGLFYPFSIVLYILFTSGLIPFKLFGFSILLWCAPFCIITGIAIYLLSNDGCYSHKFKIPINIFALILSVSWLFQVAEILVDFLQFFGIYTNLNDVIMGSTLLAWGNSVSDFFSNSALSHQGFGVMAITGCFAGQLFNLLFGFGLNLLHSTLQQGKVPFSLFSKNAGIQEFLSVSAVAFVSINLIITLAYLFYNKFTFGKSFAIYTKLIYAFFIIYVIFFSLREVFFKL